MISKKTELNQFTYYSKQILDTIPSYDKLVPRQLQNTLK